MSVRVYCEQCKAETEFELQPGSLLGLLGISIVFVVPLFDPGVEYIFERCTKCEKCEMDLWYNTGKRRLRERREQELREEREYEQRMEKRKHGTPKV